MSEPESLLMTSASIWVLLHIFIYWWIEWEGLHAHKRGCLWKFKVSEIDALVRQIGTYPDDGGNGKGVHQ